MNKSLIKILSIFLIFLFCLSPLGAIDLGQGDNSTQINDNNNTDFKDLNDTVIVEDNNNDDTDDNGMEIKRDNGTDDKKAIDNDVEIQSVSVNDSNSSKNLQSRDPKLSIEVEDSVYGEGAIAKIYFNDKYFGVAYNQTVFINGEHYSVHEYVTVHCLQKGCNVVKLPDDLPPGKYVVRYSFQPPSDYYKCVAVDAILTVHKRDPAIESSIEDINYGEKPFLNVNCGDSLEDGVVYLTSPQFSHEYKFHIPDNQKGPFTFELDENLTPGEYSCTLDYPGDPTHNSQNTTLSFRVNHLDPNLTVEAKKTVVLPGENLSVEIHANETINGDVTCTLNDDTQTVHLVNGVGYVTIDCHDLSPGNYVLCTCFDGDDIFKKGSASLDFKVKGDPKLSMHVDDSQSMHEQLHVVVDADKNFNGNVTITLNNRVWTNKIEVVNGHGEGYYAGGDFPGNYTANAKIDESEFFIASNCSTTYEVKNL